MFGKQLNFHHYIRLIKQLQLLILFSVLISEDYSFLIGAWLHSKRELYKLLLFFFDNVKIFFFIN